MNMVILEEAVAITPLLAARSLLGSLDAAALGINVAGPVNLVPGISGYRVRASDCRPDAALEEMAWRWGWRFYLSSDGFLLPAAVDVRPGRDAGDWIAGFAHGGSLAREIALLASARIDRAEGQVRLLHAPPLHWAGLWIHGSKSQLMTTSGRRLTSVASLARQLRQAKKAKNEPEKGERADERKADIASFGAGSHLEPTDAGTGSDGNHNADRQRPSKS